MKEGDSDPYMNEDNTIDLDKMEGELWLQHPKETDKQYKMFQTYKNMGRSRSVIDAYCEVYDEEKEDLEKGRAASHIYDWKKRNQWDERCDSWDRYMDKNRDSAHEEKVIDMSKRQASTAEVASKAIKTEFERRFSNKSREEIAQQLGDMDFNKLIQAFESLQRIEDKARGKSLEGADSPDVAFQDILGDA